MYESERKILQQAKSSLQDDNLEKEELRKSYAELLSAYEDLLSDTEFVTKVSDRLQRKLNTINDDLVNQTMRLEDAKAVITQQNEELKASKENLENTVRDRTRELKEAYDDLVMANAELDNFAYRAHHDLKGPIARILGLCDVARRDVQDQKAQEYFAHMLKSASDMQEIMRRLLALNRLRESEINLRTFEMKSIVKQIEQQYQRANTNEQLHFRFKYSASLLHTDLDFFIEILTNLLEYALKNSTVPTTVSKQVERHEIFLNFIEQAPNLQIYLFYTGEEIPERLNREIFELFHRTSNHPQHTGMELYTANLATRKLNGKIELISSSEEETVFSVFLPNVIAPFIPSTETE